MDELCNKKQSDDITNTIDYMYKVNKRYILYRFLKDIYKKKLLL